MNPALLSLGLATGCFALAVTIEPRLADTELYARHERSPVEVILGDARRIFAGHFFTKADAYFHSGYYPSIFDQAATNRGSHIAAASGLASHDSHEADFIGKPLDPIDKFSRSFFPSSHTHLDQAGTGNHEHGPECDHDHDESEATPGKVREMLPWVKVTSSLDPNRIETYTVGAYWLRTRMGKAKEAEAFLRQGLKMNPGNSALLFELGRIFHENYGETDRPRNVWEAALDRWNEEHNLARDPDSFLLLQITWHLALLEEKAGHPGKAINYLTIAKNVSPNQAAVEKRIQEIVSAFPTTIHQ